MKNLVQYSYDWLLYLSWGVIILGVVVITVQLAAADETYLDYLESERLETLKEQTETLKEIRDIEEMDARLRYLEESRPNPTDSPLIQSFDRVLYNSRFKEIMKERYDER